MELGNTGMTPVGETLRRERLKRHLELDQISNELKISARMLEAIEQEKFDRLPGGVFARSFVRQYARLLGLDEEELAAQAQQMIEPVTGTPDTFALPARENGEPPIYVPRVEAWENYAEEKSFSWNSWMPAAAMVIVAMLVCSGVYSWWQRSKRAAAAPEPRPAEIAQTIAPPPVTVPSAAAAEPAPATAIPPAAEPAVSTSAEAAPPQAPAGNADALVRVALTADEPVWISARADGKYLFSGVLTPNQTRTVEANDTLLIRTGNAGGLTVTLNGKPVGVLGPKGQIRTVQFTPGGFQIVAAPKPSLPL
jgi:cytoskeleton protein RodZ